MTHSPPRRHARSRIAPAVAATAAALLFPASARLAHAATFDLVNTTVDVATSPYTADDTLNTDTVTFTTSLTAATLPAAINLVANTTTATVPTAANLTFAAPLSGTGAFTKIGSGTLTLSTPSASFAGPFTLDVGTLRLGVNAPLAGTQATAIKGTLDLNGFSSLGRNYTTTTNSNIVNNNTSTPSTLTLLPYSSGGTLRLGGDGDLEINDPAHTLPPINKVGTGTLTLSSPNAPLGIVTITAGTLRLNNAQAIPPNTSITIGARTFDLNGFELPHGSYSFNTGSIVNDNTAVTSLVTSLPSLAINGLPTFGGRGDFDFTAKAIPLTKTGTGTLTLSATNTSFSGTLTVNNGFVKLNAATPLGTSTSSHFNLNGSPTTAGVIDLNGLPAPAGIYTFAGGSLYNNNTTTPSTLGPSVTITGSPILGGEGDIALGGAFLSSLVKAGPGTLTLNPSQFVNATCIGGTLRVGGVLNGSVTASGSSTGFPFRYSALDLYGTSPTATPSLTLGNNGGIVNNNTSAPSTVAPGLSVSYQAGPPEIALGGAGTLVINNTSLANHTIHKVGTGLLTLPQNFSTDKLFLREGTLQLERASQVASQSFPSQGTSINFQGGTLRIGPQNLAPQASYSFPNLWFVLNEGGTVDTTANTTFSSTVALSSLVATSGTLTKTGSGSLTLASHFNSGLSLTVNQGTLLAPGAATGMLATGTLTLNAPNSFFVSNTTPPNKVTLGALAGSADFSPNYPLQIAGTVASPGAYAGTLTAPSLTLSPTGAGLTPAFNLTGNLNTPTTISAGTITVGDGLTPGAGSIDTRVSINSPGTLALNRPGSYTLPATLFGSGTLSQVAPAATATVFITSTATLKLDLQAGTLRLSPSAISSTASSLAIASAASLDLATTPLLLPTAATDTVRQYLLSHQLFSSAADPTHAVGYAPIPGGSQIRIALTLLGDANLDKQLTPDDYALLDRSFALPPTSPQWSDGDFNYDGIINNQDYLAIDTAYLSTHPMSPSLLADRESQFGPAYLSQLLSSIPEPVSLSSILYPLSSLLLKRRRPHQQPTRH